MTILKTAHHEFTLSGGDDLFAASLTTTALADGIDSIHIRITAARTIYPPTFTLAWTHPTADIHGFWHPVDGGFSGSGNRNKGFAYDWEPGFVSKATSSAPVVSLFNLNGRNRLTFAFSDALHPITVKAGVHEETAMFHCSLALFAEPTLLTDSYEATLRVDTRDIPYSESLRDVEQWWVSLPGYAPAPVPSAARQPMYSTWYSFHQELRPNEVEKQCKLAREIGCEAVIVDDGWQTSNDQRGYAYCGDWRVEPSKIPDMRAYVANVHALGMKYILWYAVPFVGTYTDAWSRFKDKLLTVLTIGGADAGVLDPRFPDVRQFLLQTYVDAMHNWDLDGFKLDFVDSFVPPRGQQPELGGDRDYDSVPVAVDRLLTDIIEELRAIKPDVMIEFRQSYVGPLMRKYGNIFRAVDCPNDSIENRVRTLDVRLIAGATATHADMLMWSVHDPVESAALQLINVLFAVPQISMLLDKIPTEHIEMLRFWLSFWRKHRDVLLDGELKALHPELLYPVVIASIPTKRIVAIYHESVVDPGTAIPDQLLLVNGTLKGQVVLDLAEPLGERQIEVCDCRGHVIRNERVELSQGLHRLEVPASGLITVSV